MTDPYYQDEYVTLYHGDCTEILPTLGGVKFDALLTDPPYFNVKPDAWDRQWKQRDDFLTWLGGVLDLTSPLLAAHASVWVFASPELASTVETQVVAPRFRVLNSIRWVKTGGDNLRRVSLPAMRSYVSIWEGIIFAERFDDVYGETSKALHREVFAPIGRYLQTEWERAGWKAGRLGVALGYDSSLPTRWAEGSSLPNPAAYQRLRELLNATPGEYLRREYEELRREYEELRREYEELRRPFTITHRPHSTDVWSFDSVAGYPGKHPCEKPLPMLEHMITASTRPMGTILDPFMGSGSTVVAAKNQGRAAVGIELDERYCEIAANRLAQDVFDFGGVS